MSKSSEQLTEILYKKLGEKSYADIPDNQIARELFEAGKPADEFLRRTLSPPFMRFFARMEQALTHDPEFADYITSLLDSPPAYLVPYTALPFGGRFPGQEPPVLANDYLERLRAHDASIEGRHFTDSFPFQHFAPSPSLHHEFQSGESALSPELHALYEQADYAQHRDGWCTLGMAAAHLFFDKHKRTGRDLKRIERPMIETCLPYQYPAYRLVRTNSDFSLTQEVKVPIVDINDMEELQDADAIARSTALLIQLINQDGILRQELTELAKDEVVTATIRKHTQRGFDRDEEREPISVPSAITRIFKEGIGSSILPAISELRRPTPRGRRQSLHEVIAGRKVMFLTELSPLSYIGKVNLRGRGLPTVGEYKSEEWQQFESWQFTQEAKICLRAMRVYMRRQFHYDRLQRGNNIQTGRECPFTQPAFGLSANLISASAELIYLLSNYAKYNPPWAERSPGVRYYAQQRMPHPPAGSGTPSFPEPLELKEVLDRMADYNISNLKYQHLGLKLAQAALSHDA